MASVQRLKRLKVTKLSLLDQPSSVGVIALYKRETSDGMVKQAESLCKFAKKKGHLYLVSMIPNRIDSHGQWATKDQCAEACHTWQEEGCQLDFNHGRKEYGGRDIAREEAVAIENGIIQKGDPRFAGMIDKTGKEVDPTDGWGTVVQLKSKKLLKLAAAGKLNTSSLEALPGDFELVDEELPNPLEKSEMMTDEEKKTMADLQDRLAKLEKPEGANGDTSLEGVLKGLPGLIKSAITDALPKKEEEKKDDKSNGKEPDMSDPVVAKAHTRKLEKAELLKGSDLKTAKGSADYQEKLQKMADRHTKEDDKAEEGQSLRKSESDELSNRQLSDRKNGRETMADRINRETGYRTDNSLEMPTHGGK